MTRKFALQLAETITNEQLAVMLSDAKIKVKDWSVPSKSNKGLSRGVNWNLFCKDFDINTQYSSIVKFRMIEEFNEFLPPYLHPPKKEKKSFNTSHQNPIFK